MIEEHLPIVLGVAGLAAGLFVLVLFLRHNGRGRLERLSPAFELGTSRAAGPFGTVVEGLYRGFSCRYTIQHASQYNPGGASLRFDLVGPHRWSAEVANPGAQLMLKLGVLKGFEVGDSELDGRLRFSASDDGSLRALFGGEAVRHAMLNLAASENFRWLRVRQDRAEAKWTPRATRLDEDSGVLRTRLQEVTVLLEACAYAPRVG